MIADVYLNFYIKESTCNVMIIHIDRKLFLLISLFFDGASKILWTFHLIPSQRISWNLNLTER